MQKFIWKLLWVLVGIIILAGAFLAKDHVTVAKTVERHEERLNSQDKTLDRIYKSLERIEEKVDRL